MLRTRSFPAAPPSVSSDYSIISSFDVLSVSLSCPTSAGPSSRRTSSSPPSIRRGPLGVLDPNRPGSSSAQPQTESKCTPEDGGTGMAKRSKAAARRDRKRKLQAGEKERAAAAAAAVADADADAEAEAIALLDELQTAIAEDIRSGMPTPPHTPRSPRAHRTRPPSLSISPESEDPSNPVKVDPPSGVNGVNNENDETLLTDVEVVAAQNQDEEMGAVRSYDDGAQADELGADAFSDQGDHMEGSRAGADEREEIEDGDDNPDEGVVAKPRRKTRRGGVKARRRAGRAQATALSEAPIPIQARGFESAIPIPFNDAPSRSDLPATPKRASDSAKPASRDTPPVRPAVRRPLSYIAPRPAVLIPDEDEDTDEVDGLSVLESEAGTPMSQRRIRECSVMTVEDATSSIDSFLSDPRNFMTIKANKLRLWQSLCVELGLVHTMNEEAEEADTVARTHTPPRAEPSDSSANDTDQDASVTAPDTSSITPDLSSGTEKPSRHPVPQTLTQARKLLKDHAHVNLIDYLEARRLCPPAYVGAYQGLLYPSKSSMLKYTKKQGKFAAKGLVKVEWLEPLMKDWRVSKRATGTGWA